MQYGSEESQLILVPIILQLNELRVHEVKLIIVRVSVQCAGFICFSVTDDQCVQVRSEVVPCERCRRTAEGSGLMKRRKDHTRVLSTFGSLTTNHKCCTLLLTFSK